MIIRRPILCRCLISAGTPLHKHTKKNRETGQKCSKNWTSYQQRQNKNNATQLSNSRPSHTRRTRHSSGNIFNIHGNQSDALWKHRGWNQDNDLEGKWSICGSEQHLEDETNLQDNEGTNCHKQCSQGTVVFCRVLKVTKEICHMLEVFENKFLIIIMYIF